MAFETEAACVCDMGRVRKNNEDNFYFHGQYMVQENRGLPGLLEFRFHDERLIFGVFDGMGGHADGQIASYLAAKSFKADCEKLSPQVPLETEFFSNAIRNMNRAVAEEAERLGNNMGCTAVLLGIDGNKVIVCSVGDSRAYCMYNGRLQQITRDQVEELTEEERKHRKPALTQCIGIPEDEMTIVPEIAEGTVSAGDAYLLCSDGVTDMVPDGMLSAILSGGKSAGACVSAIRQAALENGGRDNLTALYLRLN